jgi:hypothetical protein
MITRRAPGDEPDRRRFSAARSSTLYRNVPPVRDRPWSLRTRSPPPRARSGCRACACRGGGRKRRDPAAIAATTGRCTACCAAHPAEAQQGLRQHEGRAGRPGLRNVGADVLHREVGLVARERRVQLRQLVESEMASGNADVVCDPRRLRGKAVVFEAQRDDGVVVRPHRTCLITVGIERRIAGGQRVNAPSAPHVRYQWRSAAGRPGP